MTFPTFRQALRALLVSPGFTLSVVVSLALGIGGNCAMFAITSAVLLRPLPYPNADGLLAVAMSRKGVVQDQVPEPQFVEWARSSHTLRAIALHNYALSTIAGGGAPVQVEGAIVSTTVFALLGVQPIRGRGFRESDAAQGADPVVILSTKLWRAQFGEDSLIIGRKVQMDERPVTVVGVMPPGFAFPLHAEFWRPWIAPPPGLTTYVRVVARARPGVSMHEVQSELERLAPRLDPNVPAPARGVEAIVVMSLHDQLFGSARPALMLVSGTVALLLLISCANVTNLVFARALQKRFEFAVRAALGAGRWALARPVLAEALLLGAAGGAVGLVLAIWITRAFMGLSPESITRAGKVGISFQVVLFGTVVSLAAALLVAIGPALRVTESARTALLREGGARVGPGRSASRVRALLVVGQFAVAVVLLSGAGLFLRSLSRLTSVELGFNPDNVLMAMVRLPRSRYPTSERSVAFFDALASRVHAMPGVTQVGYGIPPLRRFTFLETFSPGTERPTEKLAESNVNPGFFGAHGITLLKGRPFRESDDSGAPPVVVLNSAAARVFFPGVDPVGRPFDRVTRQGTQAIVVGVVADFPQEDLGRPATPEALLPFAQFGGRPETIAIRTSESPERLGSLVRAAIRDLDPALALGEVATMRSLVSASLAPHRFTSLLIASFAGLAVLLAVLGLYSVVSFLATQRLREIGVRVALGAGTGHIVRLVVGEALRMVLPGVTIGCVLALASGRLIESMLYQSSPRDPLMLGAAILALLVAAIIACTLPARRALTADPVAALRSE